MTPTTEAVRGWDEMVERLESLWDRFGSEEMQDLYFALDDARTNRDRVAGLNASESPPARQHPVTGWDSEADYLQRAVNTTQEPVGDASESPPTFDNETEACRHCPTPEVHPRRIGGGLTYEEDASESGQPSEAHGR